MYIRHTYSLSLLMYVPTLVLYMCTYTYTLAQHLMLIY